MEVLKKPMGRHGRDVGTKGTIVSVVTNHFKVDAAHVYGGHIFHYNVSISYKGGERVTNRVMRRNILDKIRISYDPTLEFAFDGNADLFTVKWLGAERSVEESEFVFDKASEHPYASSSLKATLFKVDIKYVTKISLEVFAQAFRGQECRKKIEAFRVLSIVLRQNAVRMGCQLVRQYNFPESLSLDIGGGFHGFRGYSSSIRPTQMGLSLIMDHTVMVTLKPGPILEFLVAHQQCRVFSRIDWNKAKSTLRNLRILISTTNQECRITGLSPETCRNQMFSPYHENNGGFGQMSVYDYFVNGRKVNLKYSGNYPCINVGKKHDRPVYLPIELCSLVPLAKYKKCLPTFQRAFLLEKSRLKPKRRMELAKFAMKVSQHDKEPILQSYGVMVAQSPSVVEGRILPAPQLKSGRRIFYPDNGRWSFKDKVFHSPCIISNWGVVDFSSDCPVSTLLLDLKRISEMKGIIFREAPIVIQEKREHREAPPLHRTAEMIQEVNSRFGANPKFLLCLLPKGKNCNLYGSWKRLSLSVGMITQCLSPHRLTDLYLTHVLMKINRKLGGTSSCLSNEINGTVPIVSRVPTLILAIHAGVLVNSVKWPLISDYRAVPCTFSKENWFEDKDRICEVLRDFYESSGGRKPEQLIIFRDGINESQFEKLLKIEVNYIIKACNSLEEGWSPRFLVLVAQRDRKTIFMQSKTGQNLAPGTVVDKGVCHPMKMDFFICPHQAVEGTTRPIHYYVVLDEFYCHLDHIQELVYALSHVCAGRTTSTARVAPLHYARLAARQFNAAGITETNLLSEVHERVRREMFYC